MKSDNTALIALDSFLEEHQVKLRNQLVILDSDIIKLFEINFQKLYTLVKSNKKRFPNDFMFELNVNEKKKFNHARYAFTDSGVLMLSGLINTERGIKINLQLIELFVERFSEYVFELIKNL
ncbi:MAG: ORF6N domain-containing protein [Bacteroidales bacterium]|jgi:hypothetical protein